MDINEHRNAILSLENISIALNQKPLFQNLSFQVFKSDVVGIVGTSGSGKTTLLRTIAGLIDHTEGEIKFNNEKRSVYGWTRFRREVIFVEQQPVMFKGSILENLQHPFSYRMNKEKDFPVNRVKELLKELDLDSIDISEGASSLSVGEKQRIAIIRSLILEPQIILFDEPSSALDSHSSKLLENLIQSETQTNLSVIIVTHDNSIIEGLCSQIIDVVNYKV